MKYFPWGFFIACFLCLSLFSPCHAGDLLPYDLMWGDTPKECAKKIGSFGFQENNPAEEEGNPYKESLENIKRIYSEFGLLKIRYKNQKESPSTVIYLEFIDNHLWSVAVRYNFFDEVPKGLIQTIREKTYSGLLAQYGKELDHQEVKNEQGDYSLYVWTIDNTAIVYAYNDEQPEPYLNITRVAYSDATVYEEVTKRHTQMAGKYGIQ